MLDIKGKPLTGEKPYSGLRTAIANELSNYNATSAEATLEQVKKWKEALKDSQESPMLLRDYLLMMLGSRFTIKDKKENFWTTDLGIQIAKDDNKILEMEDSRFDFLRRIMEDNTIIINEKSKELFFPYELGQIMSAFEEKVEEESETEKPVAKEKVKK